MSTARSTSREASRTRAGLDVLPPFSELTTDEDRERKAEVHEPGTFHVVVNPDSFTTLPEYRDAAALAPGSGTSPVGPGPGDVSAGSSAPSTRRGFDRSREDSLGSSREGSEDPHVVILRHFEEPTRRGSHAPSKPSPSPTSVSRSPTTTAAAMSPVIGSLRVEVPRGRSSILQSLYGEQDARLREHYRRFLSPEIFWYEGTGTGMGEDIFEMEAARFPPVSRSPRTSSHGEKGLSRCRISSTMP